MDSDTARPAERHGSAYSDARFLKKDIRPAGVERSVSLGIDSSVQDWRTWKVHVEGSWGFGTSWTRIVLYWGLNSGWAEEVMATYLIART